MTTTTYQVDQVTTNKMKDYRAHLRTITNGLEEMARAAGRTKIHPVANHGDREQVGEHQQPLMCLP